MLRVREAIAGRVPRVRGEERAMTTLLLILLAWTLLSVLLGPVVGWWLSGEGEA